MKKILLGILQKMYARRDARLATQGSMEPPAPASADPTTLLARGEALESEQDFDAALQVYRELLALTPASALAQVCAGNALYGLQRLAEAEGHYRAAAELDPQYAAARLNLGNALFAQGRSADAEQAYRQALRLRPGWFEAFAGLGRALEDQDLHADAAQAYRDALAIDPAHAGVALNLSSALHASGQSLASREVLQEALRHAPGHSDLRQELAHRHEQLGEHAQAVALYRELLSENPDDEEVSSALLFALNFVPGPGAQDLLEEHRRWGERISRRIRPGQPQRDQDPERGLRVGYLSPDFRRHPVAQFIAPLLRHHDGQAFETFCYASNTRDDDITAQVRELAAHWRPIRDLDDDAAARLIEEDRIDLLVDLAGHTSGRRLGIFARRPAPVQLTWLGYLSTTGLPAMDFRICDAHTDPLGAEGLQTETPLRLPGSQWCYESPVRVTPALMPFLKRGQWTFGSFNQWPKLNAPLLAAWGALLAAVPGSRLRIAGVPDLGLIEQVRATLAPLGIAPERLELTGRVSLQEYLEGYAEVDVALDSFPYTGGTTTCDALLMGVPVATVAGARPLERSGVSLLSALGLRAWIAGSLADLPALVQRQLADPARLSALRNELPARMHASALMDGPRFARNMEALYREAWRRWCGQSA